MNWRNSFRNREHRNLPSFTPTTRLRGTTLRPGPAALTCPPVASPHLYVHIPRALLLHPALLPARPRQPRTHLPSALHRLRCSKGPNRRTSEWRDSPPRITHNLWSPVSIIRKVAPTQQWNRDSEFLSLGTIYPVTTGIATVVDDPFCPLDLCQHVWVAPLASR